MSVEKINRTTNSTSLPPSPETEPDTKKAGNTAAQKTVAPAEYQAYTLNSPDNPSSIKLKTRDIKAIKVVDSPIRTFIAWLTGRPKPSDIERAKHLADELAESIHKSQRGEEGYSDITFKNYRTELKQGSTEHAACLFLVAAGLAEVEFQSADKVTIKLKRPHHSSYQHETASFLHKHIPLLESNDKGEVDWSKTLAEKETTLINKLLLSRILVPSVDSNCRINHKNTGGISLFDELKRQVATPYEKQKAFWQERFEKLSAIIPDNHKENFMDCRIALSIAEINDHTLQAILITANDLRKDSESLLADELELAYESLFDEYTKKAQQTEAVSENENPAKMNNWEGVLSFLEKVRLIDMDIYPQKLKVLRKKYKGQLPFDLKDLVYQANLLEKEEVIKNYLDKIDMEEMLEKEGTPSFRSKLALKNTGDNPEHKRIKDIYHKLGYHKSMYVIRKMAAKLMKDRAVTTFRYSQTHWNRAYQRLMQQRPPQS